MTQLAARPLLRSLAQRLDEIGAPVKYFDVERTEKMVYDGWILFVKDLPPAPGELPAIQMFMYNPKDPKGKWL